MLTLRLPEDFKEFLQLLNSKDVEYLVVGGYAVAYYGHTRPSAGLNIWVRPSPENAARLVQVLAEFGFDSSEVNAELFTRDRQNVCMGVSPFQIEIHTSLPGVDFDTCWSGRRRDAIDGADARLIGLEDLKTNKRAAGRPRDLDDLAHLD